MPTATQGAVKHRQACVGFRALRISNSSKQQYQSSGEYGSWCVSRNGSSSSLSQLALLRNLGNPHCRNCCTATCSAALLSVLFILHCQMFVTICMAATGLEHANPLTPLIPPPPLQPSILQLSPPPRPVLCSCLQV